MSVKSLCEAMPFTTFLIPNSDDPLSTKIAKTAGIAIGLWSVALFPALMSLDALKHFCKRKVVPSQPLIYSTKGLSAVEKLAKQLQFALKDPKQSCCESEPFIVPIPDDDEKKSNVSWGVGQSRGGRPYQEDGFLPRTELEIVMGEEKATALMYGVFDGHGDRGEISKRMNSFLKPSLERILSENWEKLGILNEEAITNSFIQVFAEFNRQYIQEEGSGGATVTCAFQIGDQIYFPNLGDSQAILIGDQNYTLTENATVELGDTGDENRRFTKWQRRRGYQIRNLRVNGRLNITRDVGVWKEMNSRPKITRIFLGSGKNDVQNGILFGKKGDFLLLASDGLFEAATIEEAASAVVCLANSSVPLDRVAMIIAEKAGSYKGNDNVTVMVIRL